jgi:uncharacterized coiled-coil protein SlyX
MEDRIIKLEEKVMLLEKYLEELDSVVREFYAKLEATQADIQRRGEETEQRFVNLGRAMAEDDDDDEPPPPHWGRK